MNDNMKGLVREWYKLQDDLKELKKREMNLRKEVQAAVFADKAEQHGTHKVDVSEGVEIVMTIPKKIEVDKEAFDRLKDSMNQRGLIGDDSLITLKPSVSATALKYLNEEDKAAFGDIFITKLGSPQMKVVIEK